MDMQNIKISEFRANLLHYLEVANSGELFCVTSNGKKLATISPPEDQVEQAQKQLQEIAKTAKIHDITSPIDVKWDAMS